jgi:3-dehydro-L-gulonate 2-dehydrogenase
MTGGILSHQNGFIAVIKISYQELHRTLLKVLLRFGFKKKKAELCARLFTDASRDGVYSHGVNRFPRFIETIRNGVVDIHAEPQLLSAHGAFERWDGRRGAGNLNAHASMERAISLSREHGIGCVALRHTNHWMRGGSYGWQAADAGVIGICWTNTMPNLPPWGASEPRLGNNPLVIAVPRNEGHIVLDMALSQFSYGTLESYRLRGEQLPVVGGFDLNGELTRDPGAIETSRRPLPIGFWKGSGLALMLDMVASLMSAGNATHQLMPDVLHETNLSQMFLAFDLSSGGSFGEVLVNQIIESVKTGPPAGEEKVRYPGERTLEIRRRNLSEGIPVEAKVWEQVQRMSDEL